MIEEVNLLGVRVNSAPTHEIVSYLDDRIAERTCLRVAFLNAHLSNLCARSDRLRRSLQSFLVFNDGVGLDIARKLIYGARFRSNLNGTDFIPAFLDQTSIDLKIFLLGARPEVIEKTAEVVRARWPRHVVVGINDGYFDFHSHAEVLAKVVAAQPDIVLVAMGNPNQEFWISEHIPEVCPAGIAVGAWFDFMAGVFPRAPAWMRRMRIEWLFRLSREPKRLASRYIVGNPLFLARVCFALLSGPYRRRPNL